MAETVIGAVELAQDAVARGIAEAERLLREQLRRVPAFRTIDDWLRAMAEAEEQFLRTRYRMLRLRGKGLLEPADYARYDRMRQNLYVMHRRADRLLRQVFASQPVVLQRLPPIHKAPELTPLSPAESVTDLSGQIWRINQPALAGHAPGLGNPAVAAPAAAGLLAWQWAAIVLLVLAAVVVVAVVVAGALVAETIRDTAVNLAYLEKQAEAEGQRESCYEACIAEENTSAECVAQCVNLHPMPVVARLPEQGGWVKWAAAAVITVALVGGVVYLVRRSRAAPRLRGAPPRYRELSPAEFRQTESNYGLEV